MKKIHFICLLLLLCLCGCSKESDKAEKEVNSGTDASDVEYIDESDFLQSIDEQAKIWQNGCDSIITDISNIEWVESVSITPSGYEEYMSAGKCTITCSVNDVAPDEADVRKTLEDYLDAANIITNYELIIIN
ncbi:MAG: hypothetical protein E7258_02040 [Lachnospiraceae bacterium]|nr:hypothetical protein [Lachnospiraceae bacterium]